MIKHTSRTKYPYFRSDFNYNNIFANTPKISPLGMFSKNHQKFISSLTIKKHREQSGMFLVEGVKAVSELLQSALSVEQVWHTPDWQPGVMELAALQKIKWVAEVSDRELIPTNSRPSSNSAPTGISVSPFPFPAYGSRRLTGILYWHASISGPTTWVKEAKDLFFNGYQTRWASRQLSTTPC